MTSGGFADKIVQENKVEQQNRSHLCAEASWVNIVTVGQFCPYGSVGGFDSVYAFLFYYCFTLKITVMIGYTEVLYHQQARIAYQ